MGPREKGRARRNQNHPRHARDPTEWRKTGDDLMMMELLFVAVEDLAATHGALDNQKTPDLGDPGGPGDLSARAHGAHTHGAHTHGDCIRSLLPRLGLGHHSAGIPPRAGSGIALAKPDWAEDSVFPGGLRRWADRSGLAH